MVFIPKKATEGLRLPAPAARALGEELETGEAKIQARSFFVPHGLWRPRTAF